MDRFYEIFRAGDYPQGSYDAEDLQEIAENYDPSFLETPITLDHRFGGPAYGWVKELKAEGDRLLASFKDVTDQLKSMVAAKQYKRHSVEIFNDVDGKGLYLKAVSMLGALTPQIKNMESIEFAEFSEKFPEGESQEFEFDTPMAMEAMALSELFSAWLDVLGFENAEVFRTKHNLAQDQLAGLIEGQFDEEADEELLERFDDIMQRVQASELSDNLADELTDALDTQFSDQEEEEDETPKSGAGGDNPGSGEDDSDSFADMTEEERATAFAEMQSRMTTLEDELEQERNEKEDFKSKNQQIQFTQRKKEFVSFLDDHISGDQPRLLPKLKDKAVSLFGHLDGLEAKEDEEQSPLEIFKDIIDGLPVIDLEEQAKKGDHEEVDFSVRELANKAATYQAEQKEIGNTITLGQAISHVKKQQNHE